MDKSDKPLTHTSPWQFSREEIAHYYDTNQSAYTRFWSRTALHYGLWYKDTQNLAEAITNTDAFITNALSIESFDVVLDAGCGVGGTSMYIAETTGARVEGITLSTVQLEIAKKMALDSSAVDRLSFSIQDYTCTEFEDATFSKLFGIESVCYAKDKADFLREAYRILQPGGKIAVVDTFLLKDVLDPREQKIYEKFTYGWVVPNLTTRTEFNGVMQEVGFTNVEFYDMQRYVMQSVSRVYRFSFMTAPFNFIQSKLGLRRENLSAWYQRAFFKRKIGIYGVFVAQKPE